MPARLTDREWQVCELIAEGLTSHEMAARLGIPDSVVRRHIARVYEKAGIESPTPSSRPLLLRRLGLYGPKSQRVRRRRPVPGQLDIADVGTGAA